MGREETKVLISCAQLCECDSNRGYAKFWKLWGCHISVPSWVNPASHGRKISAVPQLNITQESLNSGSFFPSHAHQSFSNHGTRYSTFPFLFSFLPFSTVPSSLNVHDGRRIIPCVPCARDVPQKVGRPHVIRVKVECLSAAAAVEFLRKIYCAFIERLMTFPCIVETWNIGRRQLLN